MRLVQLPQEWGHKGFLSDPLGYISLCLDEVKYFFQRGWHGYSDKDFWNAEDHLSYLLSASCEKLRVTGIAHPSKYDNIEDWHRVLTEIQEGFDLYRNNHYEEDETIWRDKLDHSFQLLHENFESLWD